MKRETFEEKLTRSKELLDRLMDPEITLEDSVKVYEEGLKNIKSAQTMIEKAKLKVETMSQEQSGVAG
jgi:exodeoxyribonuclease VII small subunit